MYCIETEGLFYRFPGQENILKDLRLQVPEKSIYGFLGPNGAGKTTTLKLVMGLLKKQEGSIRMFGRNFEKDRVDLLKRVGSLIESPSLYAQLSASENLKVFRKVYRCPVSRIDRVLQLVGLGDTKNKKAGHFSLGMKQRLGIAIALLHSPELLILDEPTNGLDPNGIIEMRTLLKQLNREEGITIVISSHLLSEIEKLVTHVGLIHRGSLIFQDRLELLMEQQRFSSLTLLDTSNNQAAQQLLQQNGLAVSLLDEKLALPHLQKETLGLLVKSLVDHGLQVYELSSVKNDLESVFIDLTT